MRPQNEASVDINKVIHIFLGLLLNAFQINDLSDVLQKRLSKSRQLTP
jgi:hypothetical protein